MNIYGKAIIKKTKSNVYIAVLTNKMLDGEQVSAPLFVQMPRQDKDTLQEKEFIFINKGFLSVFKNKADVVSFKLVILEWKRLTREEFIKRDTTETSTSPKTLNEYSSKEDLPF
jgi:hypothetical protein